MYKVSIENRKYLGSNRKILPYIKKVVEENCSEIVSFFEPFAGIGIVSNMFNSEGCSIVINDNLFSNYVIYSAFFGSEHIDEEKLKNIVEIYNNLDGNNLEDNYFAINFSLFLESVANIFQYSSGMNFSISFSLSTINFTANAIVINKVISNRRGALKIQLSFVFPDYN